MIRDRDLLAKHGHDAGVEIALEWAKLSGGAAMSEALLSGATGGVTPMLTLWNRTRGNLGIKGIGALVTMPYHLLDDRPDLTSLDELGPSDKIAVPSAGVSIQSRTLQMAAAQRWGQSEWARLEPLTVTLPHPEASPPLARRAPALRATSSAAARPAAGLSAWRHSATSQAGRGLIERRTVRRWGMVR